MAVYRVNPLCLKCGRIIRAITNDNNDLIGDNFVKWDWEGHVCVGDLKVKEFTEEEKVEWKKLWLREMSNAQPILVRDTNSNAVQLINYLRKESKDGSEHTEFRLVTLPNGDCYIHVMNRDSETLNFKL